MVLAPLAYYVTAHGYGHGVRSCDVIRALNTLFPDLPITVVSDLPVPFFLNRLGSGPNTFRPGAFDVGMVQLDSIRVDVEASLAKAEALCSRRPELIAQEVSFLRRENVRGVVADIPALPLEAAAAAGVSGIAVGNFGWDWIYTPFVEKDSRWKPVVDAMAAGYSSAELLLRLPFAEEMKAFRRIEDLPVIASPGRERRDELARLTGARKDRRWVLLSFATLEWTSEALDRVESLEQYEFFTVLPLQWRRRNIHPVDRGIIGFSDVVASVEGVVSKPGFGIVSECLVNGKPLMFADRSDFLEYAVLERAIRRYLRHSHVPASALYRGELGEWLEELWRCPDPPESIESGGAPIAARRIVEMVGSRPVAGLDGARSGGE